jgi:hypothetical protein
MADCTHAIQSNAGNPAPPKKGDQVAFTYVPPVTTPCSPAVYAVDGAHVVNSNTNGFVIGMDSDRALVTVTIACPEHQTETGKVPACFSVQYLALGKPFDQRYQECFRRCIQRVEHSLGSGATPVVVINVIGGWSGGVGALAGFVLAGPAGAVVGGVGGYGVGVGASVVVPIIVCGIKCFFETI